MTIIGIENRAGGRLKRGANHRWYTDLHNQASRHRNACIEHRRNARIGTFPGRNPPASPAASAPPLEAAAAAAVFPIIWDAPGFFWSADHAHRTWFGEDPLKGSKDNTAYSNFWLKELFNGYMILFLNTVSPLKHQNRDDTLTILHSHYEGNCQVVFCFNIQCCGVKISSRKSRTFRVARAKPEV